MAAAAGTTQIIKQSICFRAKYKVGKKVMSPLSVVPHPVNRGGEPVRSSRTMQLNGTVVKAGYDSVEANCSAVAVEEKPAVAGGNGTSFQDDFQKKTITDPDMLPRGSGIVAIAGSLSHSHLNCAMRNILGGKRGCECDDPTKCGGCGSSSILEKTGNYSVDKLETYDSTWAKECYSGLEWEVLSWKMDVEEPEAALVISIALNKKNEAAMKTGHLEIMSTLVRLCTPDARGDVPFEPVRDKLVELYGSAVDHPDFLDAFKMVMDVGGASSVHLKDLKEFTSTFVNERNRKMRFDGYAVVAQYPVEFPRLKIASIKWAWKQPTCKGNWCQVPPNIMYRFADSKQGMRSVLTDVEAALLVLSKFVSTVVEEPKEKTKWSASVDISIMAKIFGVPKTIADGKTVDQQETALRQSVAEFIAMKVLEIRGRGEDFSALPGDTALMKMVHDLLRNPSEVTQCAPSVVTKQPLVPKVIEMDDDGKPITQHETVSLKAPTPLVETIPWRTWAEKKTIPNEAEKAKMFVMLCVGWMHDHATCIAHQDTGHSMPIVLVRKGKAIEAKATRTLEIGELVVPLFFSKQSSMHCKSDGGTVHPNAARLEVSWTVTVSDAELEAGMEEKTWIARIPVYVQPELKLPDKTKDGLAWKVDAAVHPYWFIQRNDGNDVEANADVVYQDVTHVFACSFRPLSSDAVKLSPAAETYVVSVPCIVNTKKIAMGQEVILKGQPKSTKKPQNKTRPAQDAFDQITQREKKRKKSIHGGGE